MTSSTICAIPWNHLAIQQNGDYRACCQCIHPPFGRLTDGEKPMNVLDTSFDEARNAIELKEIRSQMMKGEKPAVCKLCWDEEASGLSSRRKAVNLQMGPPDTSSTAEDGTLDTEANKLTYMDVRFGNLCNQACRSCGPTDSSLWYDDAAELSKTKKLLFYGDKTYDFKKKGQTWIVNSDDFHWYNQPQFFEELKNHLSNINRFYFTGGEPTINKAHFKTLELCIAAGVAKNITLEYNSNLMAIPQSLIKTWSQFNLVTIGASIDAYGDLANYVRWPAKWGVIESNIFALDTNTSVNLQFSISSTISCLNILNFLDLIRWMLNQQFKRLRIIPQYHMLHAPQHLNVQNLPDAAKQDITKKYEDFFLELEHNNVANHRHIENYLRSIINFMNEKEQNPIVFRRLKSELKTIDVRRNQSVEKSIPWLAALL